MGSTVFCGALRLISSQEASKAVSFEDSKAIKKRAVESLILGGLVNN